MGMINPAHNKPLLGMPLNWSHPLARGIVGCWLMNEGSGNKVYDLSGNDYTGTISTGLTWSLGSSGSAIKGDDTNTHCITIPCSQGSPADLVAGKGTIIAKVNPVSDANNSIVGRLDTMWLWCSSTSNKWCTRVDSATALLEVIGSVSWGAWQTIAFTYDSDSGNAYLYKNGTLIGSDLANAENMVSATSNWLIGEDARDATGLPLNGLIEYVYLYNRALSASEVQHLYRDPFCMFRREPIELWYKETVIPPTGAGFMTLNTGYWGY